MQVVLEPRAGILSRQLVSSHSERHLSIFLLKKYSMFHGFLPTIMFAIKGNLSLRAVECFAFKIYLPFESLRVSIHRVIRALSVSVIRYAVRPKNYFYYILIFSFKKKESILPVLVLIKSWKRGGWWFIRFISSLDTRQELSMWNMPDIWDPAR